MLSGEASAAALRDDIVNFCRLIYCRMVPEVCVRTGVRGHICLAVAASGALMLCIVGEGGWDLSGERVRV